MKLGPGDPDVRPCDDLAPLGEVVTEPLSSTSIFVYTVVKPSRRALSRSIGSP